MAVWGNHAQSVFCAGNAAGDSACWCAVCGRCAWQCNRPSRPPKWATGACSARRSHNHVPTPRRHELMFEITSSIRSVWRTKAVRCIITASHWRIRGAKGQGMKRPEVRWLHCEASDACFAEWLLGRAVLTRTRWRAGCNRWWESARQPGRAMESAHGAMPREATAASNQCRGVCAKAVKGGRCCEVGGSEPVQRTHR